MNIKFYLSNGKKEKTIRACFIQNRNRQFKLQIPVKIEERYWDHKNQRAKTSMHGADILTKALKFTN